MTRILWLGRGGGGKRGLGIGSSPMESAPSLPQWSLAVISSWHNALLTSILDNWSPAATSGEGERDMQELHSLTVMQLAPLFEDMSERLSPKQLQVTRRTFVLFATT